MPPISHPPLTPLPSAAARPASTPSSDETSSSTPANGRHPVIGDLLNVMVAILFFLSILLYAIVFLRYSLHPTPPPSAAAQLAPTPPSDIFSSFNRAYGKVGAPVGFVILGGLFITVFLFFLIALHPPLLFQPIGSIGRAVRSLRRPDPALIETFPTVVYSAVKGHKIGEASVECAVCLNEFLDDDTLCLIPKCDHAFHPDCIGAWLASHTTCPVCRADLASQAAGDSASQLAVSGTEPPQVEVTVEATPPDGGAPGGSSPGGGRERIQPPDLWDKSESGSFNNRNRTRGSGRIRRFPRSHSTGHSLVRPGEDTERFTLRLPAEVSKQLTDRPGPVLLPEGCSRRGYRCGGKGSSQGWYFRRPDWPDRAVKSERWAFNRISPIVAADSGRGSSPGSVQQARPVI